MSGIMDRDSIEKFVHQHGEHPPGQPDVADPHTVDLILAWEAVRCEIRDTATSSPVNLVPDGYITRSDRLGNAIHGFMGDASYRKDEDKASLSNLDGGDVQARPSPALQPVGCEDEFEEWYRRNGYYHDTVSDRKELMRVAWLESTAPKRELVEPDLRQFCAGCQQQDCVCYDEREGQPRKSREEKP